jgi:hypothetical protein
MLITLAWLWLRKFAAQALNSFTLGAINAYDERWVCFASFLSRSIHIACLWHSNNTTDPREKRVATFWWPRRRLLLLRTLSDYCLLIKIELKTKMLHAPRQWSTRPPPELINMHAWILKSYQISEFKGHRVVMDFELTFFPWWPR